MTEKSTGNDDCNGNHDSNTVIFDDIHEKNYQKTYKYYDFSANMYQCSGFLLGEKRANKLGKRTPSPNFAPK